MKKQKKIDKMPLVQLISLGCAKNFVDTEHAAASLLLHGFGLANDAVGYIVPDNDYSMRLLDGHYHETLSLGDETGSTLIKSFMALKNDLK